MSLHIFLFGSPGVASVGVLAFSGGNPERSGGQGKQMPPEKAGAVVTQTGNEAGEAFRYVLGFKGRETAYTGRLFTSIRSVWS